MKKSIFLFFILIVLSFQFFGKINELKNEHHLLKALILGAHWEKMPSIFLDESYHDLEDYFSHSKSIKFTGVTQSDRLTFKVKFSTQGEMGVITFEKKDGKYFHLRIRNQIRPLYFIEKFRKYQATDIRLREGDAHIHFKEGYFYEPIPFKFLLIFNGEWEFFIRPNDEEERLTLKRKFKKDSFVKSLKQGIFILKDKNGDFLSRLSLVGEVSKLEEVVSKIFSKKAITSTKEKKLKETAITTAKLVNIYGRMAVLVLAGKRLGPSDVVTILSEKDAYLRLYELIIDAERKALSRRFW